MARLKDLLLRIAEERFPGDYDAQDKFMQDVLDGFVEIDLDQEMSGRRITLFGRIKEGLEECLRVLKSRERD